LCQGYMSQSGLNTKSQKNRPVREGSFVMDKDWTLLRMTMYSHQNHAQYESGIKDPRLTLGTTKICFAVFRATQFSKKSCSDIVTSTYVPRN